MDFHPLSQLDRLMSDVELSGMERHMRDVGYDARFPVVRYEGMVLDGRNRWIVAERCGIIPPVVDFTGNEEEARKFVETVNDHRRHLSAKEMKEKRSARVQRVADARGKGESIRTIADKEGVSPTTVQRDMADAVVPGVPPGTPGEEPAKTHGKDGKTYPSVKEPPKAKGESDTPGGADEGPKDAFGTILPKRCRTAYGDPWIQDAIDIIGVAESGIRKHRLADGMNKRQKLYPFANAKDVIDGIAQAMNSLDQVLQHLKDIRPAGVCPSCDGGGCGDCKMSGLVPRELYKELKVKAKAKAMS